MSSFSERFGYVQPKAITFHEELPAELRIGILKIASSYIKPNDLRSLVCAVFKANPKLSNQTETDVVNEIVDHARAVEWHRMYDLLEAVYESLSSVQTSGGKSVSHFFEANVNAFFIEFGVGWQLSDGRVVTRGEQGFEASVSSAVSRLAESGRPTASARIREALDDLSRRPRADLSGAIGHSIAAVECVLGDVLGKEKGTLGDRLKEYPFDASLKKAVGGIWGYACNQGARHGKEGVEPERQEAEFVVGICSALATYLNDRHPRKA